MGVNPPQDPSPALQAGLPLDTFTFWHEIGRLDGRINENARRIDQLDQQGPRGIDALRQEVQRLRTDLQEHEVAHQRDAQDRRTGRRWAIGLGVAAAVALIAPLYPVILFGHPGK